jgi:methionyl-tRNA formyltransferase
MRTVLLTTDTPHHAYFAWRVAERFPLAAIVVETDPIDPPFDVAHPFEALRDAYERETLLAGLGRLRDVAPTQTIRNANDAAADLEALEPDVALVFGTGLLAQPVLGAASLCLNLHGGNPEHYRGLDTHLWAIYHRDWENLVTTLHVADEGLDTGDIVLQATLPLRNGMGLHELRSVNTEACVDLSLAALDALDGGGPLPRRPQRQRGRYYSFMPAVLKDRCVSQFETHVASL